MQLHVYSGVLKECYVHTVKPHTSIWLQYVNFDVFKAWHVFAILHMHGAASDVLS